MNTILYRLLHFGVALALAVGVSSQAQASAASGTALQTSNVYYVSTTGRDTNSGSSSSPFKTFARAVSVLTPGATLQVRPGMYYEPLILSNSGTAAAPITVIGNGAILNMQASQQTGIKISGSYITVSNFEVTGATDAGIGIPGKYVTVKNNILHDNVTGNGVGTCGAAGSYSSALKVGVGGERITIEGNTVYNNCGEGIAITRGVHVLVRNNTVYDNFAPNIYVDNSPFTTVENNLVYCTGARLRLDGTRPTAIGLGEEEYSGWGAQMHDVVVSGNTIRNCGKGIGAFDSELGGTLTNITITRNYIPSGQGRAISITSELNRNMVISYNTLFNEVWLQESAGITVIGNTVIGVSLSTCTLASAASTSSSALAATSNTDSLVASITADNDTVGVFRPSNGLLYLKNTNTSGFADIAINYGLGGDCPVVGDWDGDGDDTIGVYRNGSFLLRNSNTLGFADLNFAFGQLGDQPIAGDWDGDGDDTIGVYRPSTGQFLMRNSNTAGPEDMSFYLGNVGDIGIAGDWNGDGIDTTGVFRPGNGVIFLKNTNNTGFADIALNYGLPGDQPVMGDWNNDGIDTIGVYRNGSFYLRNSNSVGFADLVFALGSPGDMAIAGDWDAIP